MASSLLCTKEYVSDSVKSKKKIKHHWTVLLSAMLRTKTATKKVMTVGTYLMGNRCIVSYLCF